MTQLDQKKLICTSSRSWCVALVVVDRTVGVSVITFRSLEGSSKLLLTARFYATAIEV